MRRVLVSTMVIALGACATKSDDDSGDAADTTPPATSDAPGSSGADVDPTATSSEPPPGTTSGAPPSVTSSDGPADSSGDPGVYFDLGVVPDAPDGKIPGCQQAIDIVFVMDVSTTMSGFLQILSDEILVVDQELQALGLDQPPHYGLAVFVDDALLVDGGVPETNAVDLQAAFDMWAAFTASNQQVGGGNSNSTWTENSLDGLFLAAHDFQWRPAETTIRMVIHTTDDTFWDGPTIGNGVMIQHGYAETVTELQDQEVRVYSFTDTIGGACACNDVTPGWSNPYLGMLAIPEATDGQNANINDVLAGTVSLSDAIQLAVDESYCDPYTPAG